MSQKKLKTRKLSAGDPNLGHCALNKQYGYIFGDSFLVTFLYQRCKLDLDLFERELPNTGVTRHRRKADFPLFFIQNN